MSDGESDGAAPHAAGDEEAAVEATEDWVVERCGVEDITAWPRRFQRAPSRSPGARNSVSPANEISAVPSPRSFGYAVV